MKPKLYILPAHRAPRIIDPEVSRPAHKTRIFDSNGTEFVGLAEVSTRPDPDTPLHQKVTVVMRLGPEDHMIVDTPPASLHDRLRSIVAKWYSVERFDAGDHAGVAAKNVRMDCANELEVLLNSFESEEVDL